MKVVPFLAVLICLATLVGCESTARISEQEVQALRASSTEGVLLISIGRKERPLPYLPVVNYSLLRVEPSGKMIDVDHLRSEVFDVRHFNGGQITGHGKQAVVRLVKVKAGKYILLGHERTQSYYLPLPVGGGATAPITIPWDSKNAARIAYQVEVTPGELTYGGELLVQSDDLSSNHSVAVSNELERDLAWASQEDASVRDLNVHLSIAAPVP